MTGASAKNWGKFGARSSNVGGTELRTAVAKGAGAAWGPRTRVAMDKTQVNELVLVPSLLASTCRWAAINR